MMQSDGFLSSPIAVLVVLLYFDIMQSVNANPGLCFSAWCLLAHFLHFKILKCVCRLTSTAQKTKSRIYIDTLYYIKVQQHDHSVFLYVFYLDSIILDPRPLFKNQSSVKNHFAA